MFLLRYREYIDGKFIHKQHSCGSKKGQGKLIGYINFNLISEHKGCPTKTLRLQSYVQDVRVND